MKMLTVQLSEAIDRVSAKSAAAAKKIMATQASIEVKLAAALELLGETTTPEWRQNPLVVAIRESFSEFKLAVKPTRKFNGVMENHYPGKPNSSGNTDGKKLLVESAKAAFGLSQREAEIFAEVDGESFTDLIMKEGAK